MVAWDTSGRGQSSDPPEGFGASDYIDCLATFIEALGLELYLYWLLGSSIQNKPFETEKDLLPFLQTHDGCYDLSSS